MYLRTAAAAMTERRAKINFTWSMFVASYVNSCACFLFIGTGVTI
jgi:hypothetical protein